jgi:hypothetical protein
MTGSAPKRKSQQRPYSASPPDNPHVRSNQQRPRPPSGAFFTSARRRILSPNCGTNCPTRARITSGRCSPEISFQRIRPLEAVAPNNLHVPAVIRLRPDNRNPPISWPITQQVLNHCNHLGARTRGIESGLGDQIAFPIAYMGRVASVGSRAKRRTNECPQTQHPQRQHRNHRFQISRARIVVSARLFLRSDLRKGTAIIESTPKATFPFFLGGEIEAVELLVFPTFTLPFRKEGESHEGSCS